MIEASVVAAALAAVLDIVSTCVVLRLGGQERNPLQRALFRRLGPLPAMLLTHGGVLLALALLQAHLAGFVATAAWLACAWVNARNARVLRHKNSLILP